MRDTIERFEATGSPVITDGEQRKYHNFWTYPVHGLRNTASDGFRIPFVAGHTRRMPRLTQGPFRYRRYADSYLDFALRYARVPLKQAVISPSALSLMYPSNGIDGYSREQFIEDLVTRARQRGKAMLRQGRVQCPDRLHRGAPGHEGGPFRRAPGKLHRPQQSRPRATDGRRARANRRAHVPRRRSRFHAQRGRGLRRAPAYAVRDERGQLLHRVGRRARSCARSRHHSRPRKTAPQDLRRRRRADRPRGSRPPKSCATASCKPHATFPSSNWARPTTAASRLSATTRRRAATSPSQRSPLGSKERAWPRERWASRRDRGRRRRQAVALGRRCRTRRASCRRGSGRSRPCAKRNRRCASPTSACSSRWRPVISATGRGTLRPTRSR